MGKREVIFFKRAGSHSEWKERGRSKLRISAMRNSFRLGWKMGKNSQLLGK